MGVSFATVEPASMELTPMRVDYMPFGATDFTDLGGTLKNVVISFKYKKAEIHADQYGETVLDRRVSGLEIMVTTELTEIKNIPTIWTAVFPHATLQTNGSDHAIDFFSAVGGGDQEIAGTLRLHPLSIAPSDNETYDYYFYKVLANEESETPYSPKDQSTLKIVWNVLIDTSTQPARFARFGKTSV